VLEVQPRATGEVEIGWTHQPPGFQLEAAAGLESPVVWEAVSVTPVGVGDLRTVTLAPLGKARFYRLRQASLTTISGTSPEAGDGDVSVTRETVVRFSGPLGSTVSIGTDRFFGEFGGRRLLSRVELSEDRRQATLFYLEPLPAASRVVVSFLSDGLSDAGGQEVDGDGDGVPGGTRRFSFDTMTSTAVSGTAVFGRVFASDPVSSGEGVTNRPLAGVIITVDGAEEHLRTQTDADGYFALDPSPAGRFFVHVDGRLAVGSAWPDGDYYPFVGKTFEAVAGTTNNPAGGTGEIFLPLVKAGTLQTVSPTQPTAIGFPPSVLAEHPELEGVRITVPPNALYADNGARGGRVGIAPVAPDRIPSPLPPGLDFPLVITIQTDGPQNFAQPVPVRFPNLPDRRTGVLLPPGAKSALWSYNHDTGRWEIAGSMTVSADGKYVESDPGVGVLQPGWHSSTPGSTGGGGGGGSGPCAAEQQAVEDAFLGCMQGTFLELLELSPGLGCAVSLASAAVSTVSECMDPSSSCAGSLAYNGLFGVLGCVPGVGTYAGMVQCGIGMNSAIRDLEACQAAHPAVTLARVSGAGLASGGDAVLQDDLLNSSRALFVGIYGDAVWMEAAAADGENMVAFGNALVAALNPGSEEGALLSGVERDALLAMTPPAGLSLAVRTALLDRFHRFAGGAMTAGERGAIVGAADALTAAALAAEEAGWTTPVDGIKQALARVTGVYDEGLRGAASGGGAGVSAVRPQSAGGAAGYGSLRSEELLYQLTDLETGFTRRGRSSPNGQLDQLITAVDREYVLTYLDPATLEAGTVLFRSGAAGDRYTLPMATLVPVDGADSDLDGLVDTVEAVVGTRADLADTDNDGASDFIEVRQRQNPLDGLALPQGVVANLLLGGSPTGFSNDARALGLEVEGSRVYVANGRRGLAIVDATDPLQPRWQGELDLPGESFDVSYSAEHHVVALVGSPEQYIPGERGVLHFVDVSDPRAPRLIESYSLPGVAVDHGNGLFGVALGQYALKEVRFYDAGSALEIARVTTQDYPTGLRMVGGRAYVATLSALEIFDVRRGALARLGRLAGDFTAEMLGRVHLVLDGSTLYIGKTRGVVTVDVSDPSAPQFLGVPPSSSGAVRSLALTGGPRMLALVSGTPTGNPTTPSSLSVYEASDPADTGTLLFGLGTTGRARDVALLGGFAAVADDQAGLTILNVAEADLNRQAPAVTLDPAGLDVDPIEPGVQVREGSTLELAPRVMDDVQLDRVELLLDGVPVRSTRSYPVTLRTFETNLVVSPWDATNLVVQFRAVDRSGNERVSDPVTLQIVRDTKPPVLAYSLPAAGQAAFGGRPFVLEFDEPVDTRPMDPSKVRLVNLGADATVGGGDDTLVPLAAWSAHEAMLTLEFPDARAGRYQLTLEPGAVADRAGNSLSQGQVLTFDLLGVSPGTAVWISDADGVWGTPANWLHGRLPAQDDDVMVQRFGAKPQLVLNSAATVKSLRLGAPFSTANRAGLLVLRDLWAAEAVTVPADSVTVNGSALFERTLTIEGGRFEVSGRFETRGLLSLGKGGRLTFAGPGAQFVPSGGLEGVNFTLEARDGAVIEVPGFADYDGPGDFTSLFPAGTWFSANGWGSKLTLSDMAAAKGPLDWNVRGAPSLVFEATGGGRLDLPVLTTLNQRVRLTASGDGSVLYAPVLASVVGTDAPFEAGIEAFFNGRVEVPVLMVVDRCPIQERDGGVVVRPGP